MQILVFGASITWGALDLEYGGWVERLKLHYFQSFAADRIHVYNLGVSGQTTDDLVSRFEREAEARAGSDPNDNVIIFSIGANDSAFLTDENAFRVPLPRYVENMTKLIELSKRYAATVGVLAITPVDETSSYPSRKGKVRKNEYVDAYNAELRRLTERLGVTHIDIHAAMKNAQDNLFDQDGLHPNGAGHEVIFKHVLRYLENETR